MGRNSYKRELTLIETNSEHTSLSDHVATISSGKTTEDRAPAVEAIGAMVAADITQCAAVMEAVKELSEQKKKPGAREGAVSIISAIADKCYDAAQPFLIASLPLVLELCSDKMKFVGELAKTVVKKIIVNINQFMAPTVVPLLMDQMGNDQKWQTHVAALQGLGYMMLAAGEQVVVLMHIIVPKVAAMMWEMKQEVKDAATQCLQDVCGCIDNRDIEPFVPALINCINHPEEVPECIHLLAATTFVQTVDSAALSIVVPLITRAFTEKSTAIIRLTAVIVENMSKLVDEPSDAECFLGKVYDEVKSGAETMSNPEARSVLVRGLQNLDTIKNKMATNPRKMITIGGFTDAITKACGSVKVEGKTALEFVIACSVSMANSRHFADEKWTETYGVLNGFGDKANIATAASAMKESCESAVETEAIIDEDEDVEDLCNCNFSLAYGSKILLNNTVMRLKRGFKYGLMGPNQCGKTTLLKAIANDQVDGFPPSDEVRTIFMETDIPVDDADLSVLEFVRRDKRLADVDDDDMKKVLASVGFVIDMKDYTGEGAHQNQAVGTLSGGWRMKVALSRAMLMRADIMLLDEPTNHLDVSNVAWVKEYLKSLKDVTCIMVSHDTGLLNDVCTHIIDIEFLKLSTIKGNLTEFVKFKPSAAQYFEIKKTTKSMKFPEPGKLEGVTSKGKPIMKMAHCTFTYGINQKGFVNKKTGIPNEEDTPTLYDITIRCSLSSRVACVGKNGAGKSTMIKLLTGELEPQTGTVWKHPNARVGYIAQHAFHHIEQHLDKTPNEYIQWRFASGDDKENLAKVTMIVTEEEEKLMKTPIEWKWVDEESGKTMKEKRVIDRLSGGRRTVKGNKFEYEVKWIAKPAGMNSFITHLVLIDLGYDKLCKEQDEKIASRANMFSNPLTGSNVERHLDGIGLEPEFGTHCRIRALSGGQKVKVVLGATLWNCPHILILDEPTNYLDRDALGALMAAIEKFEGGVVMITHNNDFCSQLCPETWVLQQGHLDLQGDPEWMAALAKEKVEIKQLDEMTDAFGNTVKIKQDAKKLSRKDKKQKDRLKKLRKKRGDAVTDSDSDGDW
jgi:elongation factor 3